MIDLIRKPIEKEYSDYQKAFSKVLSDSQVNTLLTEISNYLNITAGKALRPSLALLTAKLFGEISDNVVSVAVALELMHTSSLLHDDVIDESNLRRSRPSVNAKWGSKTAILAGDYFVSKSLTLAASTGNIKVMSSLGALGSRIAEGELVQLIHSRDYSTDEPTYYQIIEKKTACLFSFASFAGAILSNVKDEIVEKMSQYGHYLGMIFQIKDDIFDYYDDKSIGKPFGNDLAEGKLTLPLIHALDKATKDERKMYDKLLHTTDTLSRDTVAELYNFAKKKGGIEYAAKVMSDFHKKAFEQLLDLPVSSAKTSLLQCLDFAMDRTK